MAGIAVCSSQANRRRSTIIVSFVLSQDLSQRVHKETLHQLEQDADREIEELRTQYEDRLSTERDDKVRWYLFRVMKSTKLYWGTP